MSEFAVKDSGARQEFASGMVRDTQDGKIDFCRVLEGPMLERWAAHLAKGAIKYPDVAPGVANWTLANGGAEYARFKASAFRHFIQWIRGEVDEDHAAAVFFNINGAEYVRARIGETLAGDPPVEAVREIEHGEGFGVVRVSGKAGAR
jgi:hypothetical protein